MKTTLLNKNTAFSVVMAVIIGAIVYRIIPIYVSPVFNLVISKNRSSITDIHQQRDIEISKEVKVDRLDLTDKSQFRHPKLGNIGYSGDFFVDITAAFVVKKAGEYVFYMGSDDGFVLTIDDRKICEWTKERPLTVDSCHVQLTEGAHNFTLAYYQGFGNSGLSMAYSFGNDGTQYIAGDNSKYITFVH